MKSIPKRPLFASSSQSSVGVPVSVQLPVLGFPGITLCSDANADPVTAKKYVHRAINSGFSYIDVAPEYGDGLAQSRLGPALQGLDRSRIFLACKTMFRTAEETKRDFAISLEALQTDYLDLYQCHSVTTKEDVDAILAPGGALEAMKELKASNKIRHIGFSAHNEGQALRLIATGEFETVMFPLNYISYTRCGVGKQLLEAAKQHNVGVIALKAMARGRLKPVNEAEPTFVAMDLSDELGGGVKGDPSAIKHVPQEILSTYKQAPVIVHQKYKTWYLPESDPVKMQQLVRFTLGNLKGVTSAICPGSDDLFRQIMELGSNPGEDGTRFFDLLTTPINGRELEFMAEEYAKAEPIFHTGKGGSLVSHSYTN